MVKLSPEIPEVIELNRERRKQLAEIMLEYPTKIEDEEDQQEQTLGGGERMYTCLSCKRPFSSIRGKLNHLKSNPKCREVAQQETFINECKECNRTSRSPSQLKRASEIHLHTTHRGRNWRGKCQWGWYASTNRRRTRRKREKQRYLPSNRSRERRTNSRYAEKRRKSTKRREGKGEYTTTKETTD